jgi:hypothetical protein
MLPSPSDIDPRSYKCNDPHREIRVNHVSFCKLVQKGFFTLFSPGGINSSGIHAFQLIASRGIGAMLPLFRKTSLRHTLWVGLAVMGLGLAAGVSAAPPQNNLGQQWPNASDVSSNPSWHVYVFQRDGVRYIQINDIAGNVHAAFGTANGQYLVLPMGLDAARVYVVAPNTLPINGDVVYQDAATQVISATDGTGTSTWTLRSIQPVSSNATDCGSACIGQVVKNNQTQQNATTTAATSAATVATETDICGSACGVQVVKSNQIQQNATTTPAASALPVATETDTCGSACSGQVVKGLP